MYLTFWRCNVDYNIVLIKSELRFEQKHRKGTPSKHQLSHRKEFTVTVASGLASHCGHSNNNRDGLFSLLIEELMWLFWCGPVERHILWYSAIVTYLLLCNLHRLCPWRLVGWGESGGTSCYRSMNHVESLFRLSISQGSIKKFAGNWK